LVISSALFGLAVFENGGCIKMLSIYAAVSCFFFYATGIIYIVDKEFHVKSKLPIQGILNLYIGAVLTYFSYLLIMQRKNKIKKDKEDREKVEKEKEKAAIREKEDKIKEVFKREMDALKDNRQKTKFNNLIK
jgi:amino acid permease